MHRALGGEKVDRMVTQLLKFRGIYKNGSCDQNTLRPLQASCFSKASCSSIINDIQF